jgi:hypothetical protein
MNQKNNSVSSAKTNDEVSTKVEVSTSSPNNAKPNVGRSFSLEQYKKMAESFNKMSFRDKILTLQKNNDILTLASDYNWWGVKVKDKEIQEELDDSNCQFKITQEWDSNEMDELVSILGIGNTDI